MSCNKIVLVIVFCCLNYGFSYGQTPLYSGVQASDQGMFNNIGSANTSRNIAIDASGNIYVVYVGNQGIRFAKSIDRGQSYLPSIQISTNQSSEPEIAVGDNGLIFIAWTEGGNIVASRSANAGVSFSGVFTIGTGSNGVHMTVDGNNVYLIDQNGFNSYYNNNNGAGTFTRVQPGSSYVYSDILTDQNGIVYVPTDDPNLYLFESNNNGSTYNPINITPPGQVYYSSYALSDGPCGTFIFVGGGSNITSSSPTGGFKINVNTGVSTPIILGNNGTTAEGRTLFADDQGTLVDGYRSNSGDLLMNVSPDQGQTFNAPISIANGVSHNITRNPFTDDIVVVYDQNGQIFTSVYPDILKAIKIVEPVPALSFCQGTNFDLDYLITGSFPSNTNLEVFLSDATGSFANSTLIGNSNSNVSGLISCSLPIGLALSNDYQIQIRSTRNCLQSNSISLEIGGSSSITGDLDACVGSSTTLIGGGNPSSIDPWTSSDTTIATIDSNGLVTTLTVGSTQITFVDENGCTVTETFTVNALPIISGNLTVCLNGTNQITGSGTAHALNPWTIADSTVATVDNNGLVTGISEGSTTLTYTDTNGCSVTDNLQVNQDLSITGNLSLCIGETSMLTGTGTSAANNPWTITDTTIAIVNDAGVINGISTGSTFVTYTDSNGCNITESIDIIAQPSITGVLNTCVGLNSQLTGSGTASSVNPWVSSDTNIATVDDTGLILGISPGVVSITYTNNGDCQITEQVNITNGATITGNMEICELESLQLTGSGIPSTSTPWASSDSSIATINSNGLLTSLRSGSTTVTYIDNNGCDATVVIVINNLPEIFLDENYTICMDSTTNTVLSPAVIDTFLSDNDYDFEWSLNGTIIPNETSSVISAVSAGDYSVRVTNISTGCSDIFSTRVNESSPPVLTAAVTSNLFSENSTIVAMATGMGEYVFQIDESDWQSSGTFNNVSYGSHTITASDINGCGSNSVELFIISYPRYFTPNGDSFHDSWRIENLTAQYEAKVYIFDRYGKLLKQIDPTGFGWDGTYNGNPMPSGDYWFKIDLINPATLKDESYTSHFSLKR